MPTTSVSNNYTTSSGRIVKNPNNYSVSGTNALQMQKRVRIGAVTRSLISSSTSNSNNSLNVGASHHLENGTSANLLQNTERVTTMKVSGPTILPITTHDSENFMKVLSIEDLNVCVFQPTQTKNYYYYYEEFRCLICPYFSFNFKECFKIINITRVIDTNEDYQRQ